MHFLVYSLKKTISNVTHKFKGQDHIDKVKIKAGPFLINNEFLPLTLTLTIMFLHTADFDLVAQKAYYLGKKSKILAQ